MQGGNGGGWQDLFGPELKKKMNERADTIKAFNKALVTLDPPGTSKQKPQYTKNVRFLGKGLGVRYSGNPGQNSRLHNTPRVFQPNNQNKSKRPFKTYNPGQAGQKHQAQYM